MEFTTLRGGLIVRTDAVLLALDLEARGHALTYDATTRELKVSQARTLTAEDMTAIKALKPFLIVCACYVAPEVV